MRSAGIISNKVFSAVGILIFCFILAVAASAMSDPGHFEKIPHWFLQFMYLYLVFILLRTAFHLLLSFCNHLFNLEKNESLKNFPLVTIIVPCFQEEKVIEKALNSILKIKYPNYEVLVVDDGSSDETFEKAQSLIKNKRIRAIFQKNAGKAAALNKGISEARGEFIFCMDADSYLAPDILTAGLVHFQKNKNLAAVAGNVKIGNSDNLICAFQKLEYITALNFLKVAQSFLQIVTVVPGPAGLFKKSKVLEVGGYKSETFAEDCDLTLRLLLAGNAVIYEPKMYAVTEAPDDFRSLIKQRYRWSRGIVQTIKLNSKWLLKPISNFRNFFIILYMVVESVLIPTCNYLFAAATVYMALTTSTHMIIGFYFIQLVILDTVVVAYSLIDEKFSPGMIVLGLFNRFTYGLALEIQRFFSILDELLELPMTWGKLERKGLK